MNFIEYTPIFEWCSPTNRIVVKHDKPQLILTAIRDNTYGDYVSPNEMKSMGCGWNIPMVEYYYTTILKRLRNQYISEFHD